MNNTNIEIKKNIIYYCNVNKKIGYGHLTRLRVLAQALKKLGYSNYLVGPRKDYLEKEDNKIFKKIYNGYNEKNINRDINKIIKISKKHNVFLVVFDDYRITVGNQKSIKINGLKLMQFDLYAKKAIYADIIINTSPAALSLNYAQVIKNSKSKKLLGPEHALLRNEFIKTKKNFEVVKKVERIFICFGAGNDKGGIIKILEIIKRNYTNTLKVDIVSNKNNSNNTKLLKWINNNNLSNFKLHFAVKKISNLIKKSQISIISGGTISYECVAIGIPTIIFSTAANQINTSKFWHLNKAAIYLGNIDSLEPEKFKRSLAKLITYKYYREKLNKNAKLSDMRNGVNKVSLYIDHFFKRNIYDS